MQEQQRLARDQRVVAEHQHEGQQIERQRDHPQQRRRGDVGRHVHGEGGHQRGRHERQARPSPGAAAASAAERVASSAPAGAAGVSGTPPTCAPRIRKNDVASADHEQDEAVRPDVAELADAKGRLEHEGIAEQRDQAAQVAGGIHEIGIARIGMPAAGEPGLQQRRIGGNGDERQADRPREHAELPEIRLALRRLAPPLRQTDRQKDEGQRCTRRDG